jgi:uncharacterized YigZ family protein
MSHVTLARTAETELVILKSRFIASGGEVRNPGEAETFLAQIRQRYPDASHHCYAFCVLGPPTTSRCSDDGEPSGTAGRPILTVLEHRVSNAIVVVSRYFGGTKLGTGGLVKAYTRATQELLVTAGLETREPTASIRLSYPYHLQGLVAHQLQHHQLVGEFEYAAAITCTVAVPIRQLQELQAELSHPQLQLAMICPATDSAL